MCSHKKCSEDIFGKRAFAEFGTKLEDVNELVAGVIVDLMGDLLGCLCGEADNCSSDDAAVLSFVGLIEEEDVE